MPMQVSSLFDSVHAHEDVTCQDARPECPVTLMLVAEGLTDRF